MLPFTIFFMGHLIYSKGFYDLVDAYKILYKKYGNDIRFIFAGENVGFKKSTAEFLNGKYKKDFLKNGKEKNKEVQQFIKNCNKYNSDYPGFVSGEEKIKTFNKSSVFVLPSCTEGFSMSCLEAMACGLPVITTPVGAMPEVIEHKKNGIITKIGNYRKLAKDIEYFIQNRDEIERIGKYNAQYVRDNFDIEKIAEELIKILEK
jgi:glycosyltransferase involved in cell wall biosynthesis